MKKAFSILAASYLIFLPAKAEPPANSTGEFHDYFTGLKVPGSSVGCCSEADCRTVRSKFENGHWFAFISEEVFGEHANAPDNWVEVPPEAMIRDEPKAKRPMDATACWYQRKLNCFNKPVTGT